MTPRRHPRTMAEAFGPYTCHSLHPMPDDPRGTPTERAAGVILAIVIGLLFALALLHWCLQ